MSCPPEIGGFPGSATARLLPGHLVVDEGCAIVVTRVDSPISWWWRHYGRLVQRAEAASST